MNKYEITLESNYNRNNHQISVYAESDDTALSNAIILLQDLQSRNQHKGYYISNISLSETDCHLNIQDAILYPYLTKEDIIMANKKYFDVDWKEYIKELLDITAKERWSNETYKDNGMLVNYMAHTVKKLRKDKGISLGNNYALFNTGLFTEFYEAIYAYQSDESMNTIEYLTEYELGSKGISERPERANYFEKPELLLFDWHYPINIQYKHILGEVKNHSRLPKEILESENLPTLLSGAIENMKKRVSANYKLAIPQYFEKQNTIQLLLPLCLLKQDKPDLALIITKVDNYYQGHTCTTLDMAYNNARLIAKPESNWLSL